MVAAYHEPTLGRRRSEGSGRSLAASHNPDGLSPDQPFAACCRASRTTARRKTDRNGSVASLREAVVGAAMLPLAPPLPRPYVTSQIGGLLRLGWFWMGRPRGARAGAQPSEPSDKS